MPKASFHHPKNNSLESRIKALKQTRLALDSAEHYLHQNKTKGLDSVIGTKEEIEYAITVSKNSYKQAIKSLSNSELVKAQEQKLLTPKEVSIIQIELNKARIQNARDNDKSFDKDFTPNR